MADAKPHNVPFISLISNETKYTPSVARQDEDGRRFEGLIPEKH